MEWVRNASADQAETFYALTAAATFAAAATNVRNSAAAASFYLTVTGIINPPLCTAGQGVDLLIQLYNFYNCEFKSSNAVSVVFI